MFDGSILFSTLNVAYDQIITSIVDSAQNHIKLADEFNSQVVEVLKGVERKNEEAKKKVSQLATIFTSSKVNTYYYMFCHGSRNCNFSKSWLQTVIAFTLTVSRLGTCHSLISPAQI